MSGLCTFFQPSRHRGCGAVLLAATALLAGTSGCQSVPRLHSPGGVVWNSASAPALSGHPQKPLLTAVPDFDLPSETPAPPPEPASAVAVSPASANPAAVAEIAPNAGTSVVATSAVAANTPQESPQATPQSQKPSDETGSGEKAAGEKFGAVAPGTGTAPAGGNSGQPNTPSSGTEKNSLSVPSTTPAQTNLASSSTAGPNPSTNPTTTRSSNQTSPSGSPSTTPSAVTTATDSSGTKVSSPSPAPAQVAKLDGASLVDSGISRDSKQEPRSATGQAAGAATSKPSAPAVLPAYSERRPEAFAWRRSGRSAGGRPFEISLTGENGFRTLFIGSAVGNDPVSLKLMERLAKHLHENNLILGGFEAAVIHTLNPDGAASGQPTNALGRYVNGRFPLQPDQKITAPTPEVDFLLNCIRSFRPQRIVHVRTIEEASGVIASNERCAETAQMIAEGLKFSRLSYPAQSREGSLERCLSSQAELDVITLAIPRGTKSGEDSWALYGDTLLNLLQPRNAGGREASRKSPQADAKSP